MSIDLSGLSKEIQDILIMKEESEPTFTNALNEDYTDIMFETIEQRANPLVQHSYIATMYGQQGSGKSYGGLGVCGKLDPRFNIQKIFFDVELLVNERKNIKPNSAIMVDEMTRGYGVDSVRISVLLNAIKEQLRKKSIHMVYCSPTLKEEYRTSMYVLETMFLDKENKCNYFAYKTNQLLTLGYVVIPHPLHFINKRLLMDYEDKKDEHLNNLLEGGIDAIEDRANKIIQTEIFIKAEKIYIEARGAMPYKTLVQVIEKIYPEFKGSVIVFELADRIKANREIEGVWAITTSKSKKENKPNHGPSILQQETNESDEPEE